MKNAAVVLASVWIGTSAVLGQQTDPTFRARTDLVVVPVVVKDGGGQFVFGLTRQDFQIVDDGVAREIVQFEAERVPVSLGILLDISGSMSQDTRVSDDPRWNDTRRAVELLMRRLDAADEVFLAAFRDTLVPAVPWTREHQRILEGVNSLAPGGRTELFKALSLVSPMFQATEHRRKVLLLISDGQDTSAPASTIVTVESTRLRDRSAQGRAEREDERRRQMDDVNRQRLQRLSAARDAINQSGTLLYAVGIGTRSRASVDVTTLKSLTDGTGGYVEVLRDPSEISAAVARICDDLQAQYVLGFEPAPTDSKPHKISVKTARKDARVRARTTYVAASPMRKD